MFKLVTAQFIVLLTIPLTVFACEGACIIDITNEYLRLYKPIILNAFQNMARTADKINTDIVPPENHRQNAISYFTPILNAYDKVAYHGLEHAIFPSYFHGKCLNPNGTVPNGCPNPDCPVVCGTPGSMIHFFPKLTEIVFDDISSQLANITSPRTKAYQRVKEMVMADAQKTRRKSAKLRARTKTAENRFRAVMKSIRTMLLAACGGSQLSQCQWELYMKKFISKYP